MPKCRNVEKSKSRNLENRKLAKLANSQNRPLILLIHNRFLPFGPFLAINLFGIIFVRKGRAFAPVDLNHERIHTRQMRELLYVPFYLIYIAEWLVRLVQTFLPAREADASVPANHPARREASRLLRAYHRISFEREAYTHQSEPSYLSNRAPWAWRHYL